MKETTSFDVVLGFDMETDIGSYTPFYEGLLHGTPLLLQVLKSHGVLATFYWTGHAAEHHADLVLEVSGDGHETGCHGLFHETLGDAIFPLPNNWPILPSEVEGRLQLATGTIGHILGHAPVSFRCPRLWGSTQVVNTLEKLGYISDASLPLYYFGRPFVPYFPSREDWTRPGESSLLEIPNFCDLEMESRDAYGRDRDQWPLFRTESAESLMEMAWGFIGYVARHGHRPVLCFYFHPWEFYPMPEGAIELGECSVKPQPFITRNCGPYAVEQLDRLFRLLKGAGGRFVTAGDLAREHLKLRI